MKKLLPLLTLILSTSVFAECNSAYQNQIKNLETRMNSPRAVIFTNLVAEGAVLTTLAAVGTIPVTAVVALPAAALGSAVYFESVVIKRNGLRNAMHVIREAHKGSGKQLDRFMDKLNNKDKEFNREDVIQFLVQGDFDNKFCELDEEKDTYDVLSIHKLLKLTKEELSKI